MKWNIVTDMSSVSPAKTGAINRTGIDSDARRDELSNLLTREITGFHGDSDFRMTRQNKLRLIDFFNIQNKKKNI